MFGFRFFAIIPEKSQYIVERFGKFHTMLNPGFNFLVPILDRIAYKHSLKEEAISIDKQQAITKDNVTISIDGIMFVQVNDTYKASYTVENPKQAVQLLCLTILRSEIGKMKLDQLLQERAELNKSLHSGLNLAAEGWVEILQIDPPEEIKRSMQYEAEAERLKRRDVLKSEGQKLSEINIAKGEKAATVLRAEGDAESMKLISEAEATALKQISQALAQARETKVVDYILLSNYLTGYQGVLKKSNVVMVPKGKGEQGNDLLSLAGMMLFQNTGRSGQTHVKLQSMPEQPQYSSEFKSHTSNTPLPNASSEPISKQDVVETLIKKGVYYDDVSLYSSGDESVKPAKKKKTI